MLLVRRILYRALVVGLGEELLALALVPESARGPAEAGYPLFPLFLAVPAALVTLVEHRAAGPARGGRRSALVAAGSFVAALAGVVVAHFQAHYTTAILQTRSVPDGIKRGVEQWDELFVKGVAHTGEVLGMFFLAVALAFAATATLARDKRLATTTRAVAIGAVTVLGALLQETARIYWNDRVLEHASVVVSLSLPVFFGLADHLADRAPQTDDEQNAR